MSFLYVQTTYVNAVLSNDVYFVFFCDHCLLCIVQHVRLSLLTSYISTVYYIVYLCSSLSCIYVCHFYHINLFNFMQGCGLTTRIKVTFDF